VILRCEAPGGVAVRVTCRGGCWVWREVSQCLYQCIMNMKQRRVVTLAAQMMRLHMTRRHPHPGRHLQTNI